VLGIAVAVGTERKGLTGSPGVVNIYLETGKGTMHINRLRDIPKILQPAPVR
jgi:hypothetical protein